MAFDEFSSNFFCVLYLYSKTHNNYFQALIFTIINNANQGLKSELYKSSSQSAQLHVALILW